MYCFSGVIQSISFVCFRGAEIMGAEAPCPCTMTLPPPALPAHQQRGNQRLSLARECRVLGCVRWCCPVERQPVPRHTASRRSQREQSRCKYSYWYFSGGCI